MIKRLLVVLFLCASAWATTTVSGNIKNLGTSSVSAGTFVRFYLRGCAGNLPRINGTAIIAPTLGNVYYFDFVPNASGAISGTLYSTRDSTGLLGGDIECGGSTTAVWYGFVPFVNGKAGPETPIHAKNTATIDISNITPITTNPVITAPTGDGTYLRLDAGNGPLTAGLSGPFTVNGNETVTGTAAVTGNETVGGTLGVTGATTLASLNKVVYVDQQAGATADVKFANACTALPAGGGVLDARGFGPTTQSIAATVSCGSQTQPVTFIFDPSTVFQPSTAALNIFQINYNNVWDGLLHVDTSNQATYSGNAIQLPPTTSVSRAWIRAWVVMSSGATGPCFTFTSTGSNGIAFSDFDITCTNVGTAADAVKISAGGTSFFNGNHIKLTVNNTISTAPKYCMDLLVTAAGAGIGGNELNIHCEMNNISTSLAGIHMNTAAVGNSLGINRIQLDAYDIQGTNQAVIIDATNVCNNSIIGILGNGSGTAVTDNSTCGLGNEYHDLLYGNSYRGGNAVNVQNYESNLQVGCIGGGAFPCLTPQIGTIRVYGGQFFVQQGNPAGLAGQDSIYGDSTGIKENVNNAFGGSNSFGLLVFAPCVTTQKTETGADANVLTCAIPGGSAGPGTYRINFTLSLSAANAATLGWTATWTDSNGNAQTPTNLSLFQSGTAVPALTFTTSAAGNYYGSADIDVNNGGAAVVVKLTFSGTSFTGKASAIVERIN